MTRSRRACWLHTPSVTAPGWTMRGRLLAAGRVALINGFPEEAASRAREAAEESRSRGDRAGLAHSLELGLWARAEVSGLIVLCSGTSGRVRRPGLGRTRCPLAVEALGRFRVLVDDEPVPLAAWQSRKARDLLESSWRSRPAGAT